MLVGGARPLWGIDGTGASVPTPGAYVTMNNQPRTGTDKGNLTV